MRIRTKPWMARAWASATIGLPVAWHFLVTPAQSTTVFSVLSRGRL